MEIKDPNLREGEKQHIFSKLLHSLQLSSKVGMEKTRSSVAGPSWGLDFIACIGQGIECLFQNRPEKICPDWLLRL